MPISRPSKLKEAFSFVVVCFSVLIILCTRKLTNHCSISLAYSTSCDDDSDEFHECDFFNQFLGPTKWIHLTPEAQREIDEVHFKIWKDVWSTPSLAVDVADKVSKECLRYVSCVEMVVVWYGWVDDLLAI